MWCQSVNKYWVFPKIKYSLLTILNLYENLRVLKASQSIVFNYNCCQKKKNIKKILKKGNISDFGESMNDTICSR